jgi:acetylglutamate kinase
VHDQPDSDAPLSPTKILTKESGSHGTTVIKIGGSTLGEHDSTVQDLAALQRKGINPVVVHGGGSVVSEWMTRQGVRPTFKDGLRVTDAEGIKIVVAVLAGLVNKELVVALSAAGARAVGVSGADGGMLRARIKNPELGYVGAVTDVDTSPIRALLADGCMPVIAPVAIGVSDEPGRPGFLLNINADTVAGEVARALGAERLIILTDVEGVLDGSRRLIPRLTKRQADDLKNSRVVAGGMIPKIEACLLALESGAVSQIIDGRKPGALSESMNGKPIGTRIG